MECNYSTMTTSSAVYLWYVIPTIRASIPWTAGRGPLVLVGWSLLKVPRDRKWRSRRLLLVSQLLLWAQYWYQLPVINQNHYNDVIMAAMASQISSPAIVYKADYSGAAQRKHQSSSSLVFVLGIHQWPVNSPHKGPVTRKMLPLGDVIRQKWQTEGRRRIVGWNWWLSARLK